MNLFRHPLRIAVDASEELESLSLGGGPGEPLHNICPDVSLRNWLLFYVLKHLGFGRTRAKSESPHAIYRLRPRGKRTKPRPKNTNSARRGGYSPPARSVIGWRPAGAHQYRKAPAGAPWLLLGARTVIIRNFVFLQSPELVYAYHPPDILGYSAS